MSLRRAAIAAAAVAVLVGGCGGGGDGTSPGGEATAAAPEAPELGPCKGKPAISDEFRCGAIEVPKYRSDPERGSFEIGFAVRPRDDRGSPSEGAIFAAEGGPGYASTGSANAYLHLFGPLLEHRELVLVDMRGTGRSGSSGSRSTATPTAPTSPSPTRSATPTPSTRSSSTAPTRSPARTRGTRA